METDYATQKLREFYFENNRLPSYSELADIFSYASKNAGYKLANRLVEAGVIERDPDGKLVPGKMGLPLPQLGSIQAGFPTYVDDEVYDAVSFDHYLIEDPRSSFLLRVNGDSMKDAGINEDDLVIIQKTHQPRQGDIVAACLGDNECTLKYFELEDGRIVLLPANENYEPIYPSDENFKIYGKVVGLVRKYRKKL